jgi:CheY-like chemotaxis protein/two-component sensor histidine kinase
MSKIEADKFELSHVSFNFRKMLNNIIDFIDFSMTERKQKFFVSVDDKIPQTVVGDDQRLSQVITNLLTNSVKFTPENGTIRLSVELKSEYEGIYCLLITIEDTGVGISDEHKGRLFDLYEQAKSDTSRTYGGSGLGLSISKRLVELMGGEIHVESEVNKGSKFIFTIALTRDSGEKDRLSPDIGDVLKEFADVGLSARQGEDELYIDDFSGYTALLVEDIAINREIVVTLLEPTKISIECVENGKQALDVIEEDPTRYDIIFMDIQMPEMDGYEATLKIRALEDEHASIIPIVAMTANVFREDIEKCIEVGMNAHLGKPLILEDVISQMRLFLQGKQHVTKIERRKEERRKLADRRQLTNIWLSQDILQLPDIANITEDAWEGED